MQDDPRTEDYLPEEEDEDTPSEEQIEDCILLNLFLGHSPEDAEAAARGDLSFWKDRINETEENT